MESVISPDYDCDLLALFSEEVEDLQMRVYSTDFETTTDPKDCRVWAWAICQVGSPEHVEYGTDISSWLRWMCMAAPCKAYFHNLAFDGAFIQDYLLKNGWKWCADRKPREFPSFTTVISDMNQVYCIELWFDATDKVTLHDSLKVIPMPVRDVAKAFGLDEGKGDLDYTAYREPGHELTDEEKDYIRRDVQIVAHAMKYFNDEGMTHMTAGSNALHDYKQMCGGNKNFRKVFPVLEESVDSFCRKAYRGGFTYCDPRWASREVGEGIVFDVNSLYPSVMHSCDGQELPVYQPVWYDGQYTPDPSYPLWIGVVTCSFKLKPDHIPCIQLKGNARFCATEYLSESHGLVTWAVTNVDWDLITQQYDVRHVSWGGGFKFRSSRYQFTEYIDKWTERKVQAGKDGNKGMRTQAKLMLNSLYGKFATRRTVESRYPTLTDEGALTYADLPPTDSDGVYLPVGVFVTSWARFKTVTSCQRVYDRFIYADTDSMHLIGTDVPRDIDVDPYRLGAWKLESHFTRAKFIRAKCYMELMEEEERPTVHVAGMPANVRSQVTFDNFELGAEYDGKLYQHKVPGGIVLVPGKMQIRGV